jgi:hypothetical protein
MTVREELPVILFALLLLVTLSIVRIAKQNAPMKWGAIVGGIGTSMKAVSTTHGLQVGPEGDFSMPQT